MFLRVLVILGLLIDAGERAVEIAVEQHLPDRIGCRRVALRFGQDPGELGPELLDERGELVEAALREQFAGSASVVGVRHAAIDDLLPEAFAVVREAGKRVHGMRHFDVQLVGGMVLHNGKIAEMRTGEGKTLVATLPVYLNALAGKGVHVVTVNDYLARRDAEWMGKIYRFLGLTVGVIVHDLEASYRTRGARRIAGVDEAGRGPLAGPVVAAAVIIAPDRRIKRLADAMPTLLLATQAPAAV